MSNNPKEDFSPFQIQDVFFSRFHLSKSITSKGKNERAVKIEFSLELLTHYFVSKNTKFLHIQIG